MAFKIPLWAYTTVIFSSVSAPIIQNVATMPNTPQQTYNYFFRLPLKDKNNQNNTYLINEDKSRIEGYYKKYFSHPAFVNKITEFGTKSMEGENNPNFFIQVKKGKYEEHRELEWLKTIKLNQITIDRYYEKKTSDSDLLSNNLFKELIKTENLLPKYTKSAQNALNQEAIDLFFKGTKISNEEIKKLVYFPSEQIGTKRWYVWLDKDLLRLKLNFGFHIWFFKQTFSKSHSSYRDFFQSNPKKGIELRKKINTLYKQLTEEEKEFFELYYSTFWRVRKNSSENILPQEITSEEINKMYNLLKEKGEKLDVLKDHLLQVVEGGDKLGFESFFPNYITYASGPDALYELDGGSEFKSNVKVTVTPDKRINLDWKVNEILDIFKNYSIMNFTLRTSDNSQDQWPSSIFSNSAGSGSNSAFSVIREEYFVQNKVI